MNGIAALAVKEAAAASGLSVSLLPGIAPSAVDGFAVGTLLSGLCFLVVMSPRRRQRRNRLSAKDGVWPAPAVAVMTTDLYAEHLSAPQLSHPYGDESAEVMMPFPAREETLPVPEPKGGNYRSKHRQANSDSSDRRPETKRSPGRHAAPSTKKGGRVTGRLAFHPLAVRD